MSLTNGSLITKLRFFAVAGAALLVAAAPSSPAGAQDGPTYAETLAFLQSKLNTMYRFDSGATSETVLGEIQKCTLDYRDYTVSPTLGDSLQIAVVDLRTVDPTKISPGEERRSDVVNYRTREGKQTIKTIELDKVNLSTLRGKSAKDIEKIKGATVSYGSGNSFIHILGPLDDNVPRVVRAFTHLVKLCGGKGELF